MGTRKCVSVFADAHTAYGVLDWYGYENPNQDGVLIYSVYTSVYFYLVDKVADSGMCISGAPP